MQGQIITSRTRCVEEGKKPTKYFCDLDSRNFLNTTIKRVKVGNNTIEMLKPINPSMRLCSLNKMQI